MTRQIRLVLVGFACCSLLSAAGCRDDEVPTAPRDLTDGAPAWLIGSGSCTMSGEVEICRLPALGGVGGLALDVNDDEWIVGLAQVADGNNAGVLWKPDGTIINLASQGIARPQAVSDGGWVAGTEVVGGSNSAIRWNEADGKHSLGKPGTMVSSNGLGVNDAGHVAGFGLESFGIFRPLRWRDGWVVFTGFRFGRANDINNAGRMAGTIARVGEEPEAAVWPPFGSPGQLGTLDGDTRSEGLAINDAFLVQIVGSSGTSDIDQRPFIHRDGQMMPLSLPPGHAFGIARDLNDHTFVVGETAVDAFSPSRAVMWKPDGTVVELGSLGGPDDAASAQAINNVGTIVGYTRISDQEYPTVWRVDLDVPPGPVDSDGDGIEDAIDPDPEPSTFFSDIPGGGTTSGTIERADFPLTVNDLANPAGVVIEGRPEPFSFGFSRLSVCDGAALFFPRSSAGFSQMGLTCGSVEVDVFWGAVDASFFANDGSSWFTTLSGVNGEPNGLRFDPVTATFTAPETNRTGVSILDDFDEPTFLRPGESVTFGEATPVVANAGVDQTLECTGGGVADVTLDGSGSSGAVTYTWRENGQVIAGPSSDPTTDVSLGVGEHMIELTVENGGGGSSTDEVVVTVEDTEAPTIDMTVDPTELWPPNHKMVRVASGISASDACCAVTLHVEVTSDEPVNGQGDGNTEPDWDVIDNGDGTYDVWVRAERAGGGDGRVYTISATATDCAGNVANATAEVTVAKSKGKKK